MNEAHDISSQSKTPKVSENLPEKSKDGLTSETSTSDAEKSAESSLSHQDAMRRVQNAIGEMITRDPLLYDLPPQVTVEEINSCIALEHGQAMVVNVRRADDEIMDIIQLLSSDEVDIGLYGLDKNYIDLCLIALEHAMLVNVQQADDNILAIVVTQDATVLDLKHAIKRHITLKQLRNGGKQHISWRYIWKRFWLYFDGQKLKDDKTKLKEYGIQNKDEISFMKKLAEK